MNKKKKILQLFLISATFSLLSQEDEKDVAHESKRSMRLNNLPISIFTPRTDQFSKGGDIGPTGATGALESDFVTLSRTLGSLSDLGITALFSGETATFDDGFAQKMGISTDPFGPSVATPAEYFSADRDGYYMVSFFYVGSEETLALSSISSYTKFQLLINGTVDKQFTLTNLGIRQEWNKIIALGEGDIVSIRAASDVPFLTSAKGLPAVSDIGNYDAFILTVVYLGPFTIV